MAKRRDKPEPHAVRARAGRAAAAPASIAAECLALRARVLNRALSSIYDRALAPHELKVSQFNLLVAIGGHPGVLASRLGNALCIDESTLSRNLERLRERGWIEIEAGGDSRSRPLRLTAVGRAEFERACVAWRRAQDEALEQLGAQDAAALMRIAGRYLGA
jgi:DNA-binding MarR family transcriptional regulator